MAVRIRVASHPDVLVGLLCDELVRPVGDLFSTEIVAVPSRGIERWLTQQIASGMESRGGGEGICANVAFPSPERLVRRVLDSVPELAASTAAWENPGLTASLLTVIDATLDEPWMTLIARYLDDERSGVAGNRLGAAERVARLFSRYARRRPDMIRAWARGEDVGPGARPIPTEHAWQPRLWRALREAVSVPSLAELLPGGLDPIRSGEVEIDLPERLSVYGLTSTDPVDLSVLGAIGERRSVDLYVLHPSPALWEELQGALVPTELPERHDDPSAGSVRHPLLRAWGRDSRELQTVLAVAGFTATSHPPGPAPDTVLGRLQSGIRENRVPEPDESLGRRVMVGGDRSVQVHVCHGARRQAEVARDAILHLMAADRTLEPRDVVIMTPDLETFAPLLEAAFPPGNVGGLPDLRLRIADRSPAATNPLVGFAASLLDAAGSRLEAGIVREMVDRPVVQNRFGFDADTAGAIRTLIDDANVAWGLDVDHRREWGVSEAERTWRRGLDRALAGVFYADDPVTTVGGLSPLEGVEGQEATPAGILAAIVDRLEAVRNLTSVPRPMSEWAGVIARSVRMLAAPAWSEEWQIDQLERLLVETFPAGDSPDPEITLDEARRAIARWSDDRPSPLHFRTGDTTVCTLVPMRSVPYRVVVLVGMDEDRFPRRGSIEGDDLLNDHELVGDTEPASQDRQLLLDAVLAAGDNLIVTYSGGDELTNATIPPAVPVAELCDTVETLVGREAMSAVVTRHPLQSFSLDNFRTGRSTTNRPWGFDITQLRAARALQQRSHSRPAPPSWPEPPEEDPIRLKDLVDFLQAPVGRFVRARLGFTIPQPDGIPDDTIPADLDSLTRWSVTDRLLSGLIAGHDVDQLRAREKGSDALPPGRLGEDDLDEALQAAETLWQAAREHDYDPRRHEPFAGTVVTPSGAVEGTVTADPERSHLAKVTPSRLKARHRLEAWTRLLFVTALRPELAWKAVLLGRRDQGDGHVAVTIGPLKGSEEDRRQKAISLLETLIDLYREGHRRPLPLPCETGYLWQRHGGADGEKAWFRARDEFQGRFGDSNDPAHRMVLPEIVTFRDLQQTDFADFCSRLWLPILNASSEKRL